VNINFVFSLNKQRFLLYISSSFILLFSARCAKIFNLEIIKEDSDYSSLTLRLLLGQAVFAKMIQHKTFMALPRLITLIKKSVVLYDIYI